MGLFDSVGLVNKNEFLNKMRRIIHSALSLDSYDNRNIFHKAYGINGLYYSDVDEAVTAPIVIIKREDLTRLIATEKVLSYYQNYEEGVDIDEKIKKKQKEIEIGYLREKGMSQSDIDFFSELLDKNP